MSTLWKHLAMGLMCWVGLASNLFGQTVDDPRGQSPKGEQTEKEKSPATSATKYFPRNRATWYKLDRVTKSEDSSPVMPHFIDEIDGEWCRVSRYWIKRVDLVPISDAAAYYSNELLNTKDKLGLTLLRGHVWKEQGRYDRALVDYTTVITLDDDFVYYRVYRAEVYYKLGDTENAISDLREMIRRDRPLQSDRASVMLAWILATTPDEQFRDSRKALEIVQQVKNRLLPDYSEEVSIVLAAAYADIGDFEQAVKYQEQVVSVWRSHRENAVQRRDGRWSDECAKLIETHKARLALFKKHRPYRDELRTIDLF